MKRLNPDFGNGGNRFKFLNRSARAKHVDVNVSRRIRSEGFLDAHSSEVPEAGHGGCFFQDELERAKEMNTTPPFKRFYYCVWPFTQSLAELIHHSKVVVSMLLELLEDPVKCGVAGEQLLQLLSVLARDLQSSFHPYLIDSLECLTNLIQGSYGDEPESAGRILRTVGFLLMFDKSLMENPDSIRVFYSPFLGHRLHYVRAFAAETFSAVLRKLQPKILRNHVRKLLLALAQACSDESELSCSSNHRSNIIDGCSRLFFFTIKGISGRTHSKGSTLLRLLLGSIIAGDFDAKKKDEFSVEAYKIWYFEVVLKVADLLRQHLRSSYSNDTWMELQYALGIASQQHEMACKLKNIDHSELTNIALIRQLEIMTETITFRNGILLREQSISKEQGNLLSATLDTLVCQELFLSEYTSDDARVSILDLTVAALHNFKADKHFSKPIEVLIGAVANFPSLETNNKNSQSRHLLLTLMNGLLVDVSSDIVSTVLPMLLDLCDELLTWQTGIELAFELIFQGISAMKMHCILIKTIDSSTDQDFDSVQGNLWFSCTLPLTRSVCVLLIETCRDSFAEYLSTKGKSPTDETLFIIFRCLPFIIASYPSSWTLENSEVLGEVFQNLSSLIAYMVNEKDSDDSTNVVISMAIETGLALCNMELPTISSNQYIIQWYKVISNMLIASQTSLALLRTMTFILRSVDLQCNPVDQANLLGAEASIPIILLLSRNLKSDNRLLRLHTIRLLSKYAPLPYLESVDSNKDGSMNCNAVQILTDIEESQLSLQEDRSVVAKIMQLEVMAQSGSLPEPYHLLIASHCLGFYSIKYSNIWEPVSALFRTVYSLNESSAWNALSDKLHLVNQPNLKRSATSATINSENHAYELKSELVNKMDHSDQFSDEEQGAKFEDGEENSTESENIEVIHEEEFDEIDSIFNENVCKAKPTIDQTIEDFTAKPKTGKNYAEEMLIRNIFKNAVNLDTNADICLTSIYHHALYGVLYDHVIFLGLNPTSGSASYFGYTDNDTLHSSIWGLLGSFSGLLKHHSKTFISMIFTFFCTQYLLAYPDDCDVRSVLSFTHEYKNIQNSTEKTNPICPSSAGIRTRLLNLLKFLSEVGSCVTYRSEEVLSLSSALLLKSDVAVAKSALNVIISIRPSGLLPYRTQLLAVLDDKKIKQELVNFNIDDNCEDKVVIEDHRARLIPVLIRILFGRFGARPGGRAGAYLSHRGSIMSFLRGLRSYEFGEFVLLMVRVFVPKVLGTQGIYSMPKKKIKKSVHIEGSEANAAEHSGLPFVKLLELVEDISFCEIRNVGLNRKIGFLNMVHDVTKHIGHKTLEYIRPLISLTLKILTLSEEIVAEKEELKVNLSAEMDEVSETSVELPSGSTKGLSKIRPLAIRAISAMLGRYASEFDFLPYSDSIWTPLKRALVQLPGACVGLNSPTVLLKLLELVTSTPELTLLIEDIHQLVVPNVAKCIGAARVGKNVVDTALSVINSLLEYKNGELLVSHIDIIVEAFVHCLDGKIREEELQTLSNVAEFASNLSSSSISEITATRLATLLLLILKQKSQKSSPARITSMRIIASLSPQISDVAPSFMAISRLLGPNKGVLTEPAERREIISALQTISKHPSLCLNPGMQVGIERIANLNSYDQSRAGQEDFDFDKVIPVLALLSEEQEWKNMMILAENFKTAKLAVIPVLYHCIYLLHNDEMSLKSAATSTLKSFISQASQGEKQGENHLPWLDMVDTIVQSIRGGVLLKSEQLRRPYILLLQSIALNFSADAKRILVPSDLSILARPDDLEVDFFSNMVHLQFHRRIRALKNIRRAVEETESLQKKEEMSSKLTTRICPFSEHTIMNYLMPLVLHPLYEVETSTQQAMVAEGAAAAGALSRHLSWKNYYRNLMNLIRNLKTYPHREKPICAGICAVLDSFHFEVTAPSENDSVPIVKLQNFEINDENKTDFTANTDAVSEGKQKHSIYKVLSISIIPELRRLLNRNVSLDEQKKAKSNAPKGEKMLRPAIALALLKLLLQLPNSFLEKELDPLLLSVCVTLKAKDSNERESARGALAKMAADLGPNRLESIINHMSTALHSGYQLHVRTYTLCAILHAISDTYAPPIESPSALLKQENSSKLEFKPSIPSFDKVIPRIVSLCMDDLFGDMSEARESDHFVGHVSKTKEAKGAKVYDIFETVAKMLLFRPSYTAIMEKFESGSGTSNDPASVSGVHALVSPLLIHLDGCESRRQINKVAIALERIVLGLGSNPSITAHEMLLYVHATTSPFLLPLKDIVQHEGSDFEDQDVANSSDSESEQSGMEKKVNGKLEMRWLKSDSGQFGTPSEMKRRSAKNSVKVLENTPELTGRDKHAQKRLLKDNKATDTVENNRCALKMGDPVALAAIIFGLNLLLAGLKNKILDCNDSHTRSMISPFVPLLRLCIMHSPHNNITLLGLKVLSQVLHWNLNCLKKEAPAIGRVALNLLTNSGVSGIQSEISQACFKLMTVLTSTHVEMFTLKEGDSKKATRKTSNLLGLNNKQTEALLTLLKASLLESDQHASTFALLKVLVSHQVMSSLIYDIMDSICKLAITSHRESIRTVCTQIFIEFLLSYPLAAKRIENHFRHILEGTGYQHEEGRVSALNMVKNLVRRLPAALLEEHANLFFLALTLRIVGDESQAARASASEAGILILTRVSSEVFMQLWEYFMKWFGPDSAPNANQIDSNKTDSEANGVKQNRAETNLSKIDYGNDSNAHRLRALSKTASICSCLAIQARPDLVKKRVLKLLIEKLSACLPSSVINLEVVVEVSDTNKNAIAHPWECVYHAALCLERVISSFPGVFDSTSKLFQHTLNKLCACLLYPHAWVRLSCARALGSYLSQIDTVTLKASGGIPPNEWNFLRDDGGPFKICKQSAAQLDRNDVNAALIDQAVKNLVWASRAMYSNPELCRLKVGPYLKDNGNNSGDEIELNVEQNPHPLVWIFHRMSYMARLKGDARRKAVFKWFAAMCTFLDKSFMKRFLPHMLIPLQRCVIEGQSNNLKNNFGDNKDAIDGELIPVTDFASQVMEIIEEKVGAGDFLEAITKINRTIEAKRDKRKADRAFLAVTDPVKSAKIKVANSELKKQLRKKASIKTKELRRQRLGK